MRRRNMIVVCGKRSTEWVIGAEAFLKRKRNIYSLISNKFTFSAYQSRRYWTIFIFSFQMHTSIFFPSLDTKEYFSQIEILLWVFEEYHPQKNFNLKQRLSIDGILLLLVYRKELFPISIFSIFKWRDVLLWVLICKRHSNWKSVYAQLKCKIIKWVFISLCLLNKKEFKGWIDEKH